MNRMLCVSGAFVVASFLGGCAVMSAPEEADLGCGKTKEAVHYIPTIDKLVPVSVSFTKVCEADQKYVQISMKSHPWGIGKTMPRSVGNNEPRPYGEHQEKIPCQMTPELVFKWKDMKNYEYYAQSGRPIININDAQIDMRFREDYILRYEMLNTAKNICSTAPR